MMTDEKVEECVHMLREKNAEATIISTPWEELGKDAVLHALQHGAEIEGIQEEHAHEHDDHEHHHHHDDECGCGHDHDHDHGDECTCGCHDHDHHHHHADEVFTSWGKETPHKYNEDKLREILDTLADTEKYGGILRAKGIVPSDAGEWLYFDLVPGEFEVRKGKADITGKLCVIGSKLKENDLAELFEV